MGRMSSIINGRTQEIALVKGGKGIALLAKESYFPGSEINRTVVGTAAAQSFITCQSQFKDKADKYNIKKLHVINKCIGVKNKDRGYRYGNPLSLFRKNVSDKFNRTNTLTKVSSRSILAFKTEIEKIDITVLTDEDLVRIAKDFDDLCQGFVESAVDCAKDKSKIFDYAIDEFIGFFCKEAKKKIKPASRLYKEKQIEITKEGNAFKKNVPSDTDTIMLNSATKDAFENGKKIIINDATAQVAKEIMNAGMAGLTAELGKALEKSENKVFSPLGLKINALLKAKKDENVIIKVAKELYCIIELMDACFKKRTMFEGQAVKLAQEELKDIASSLRNVAYTIVTKAGFKAEKTLDFAIMACHLYTYNDKWGTNEVPRYFAALSSLFRLELADFLTKERSLRLNIVYSNVNICEGAEFELTNGICKDVDEDGNKIRICIRENYSGKVVMKSDGLYPKDKSFIYDFDTAEFILLKDCHTTIVKENGTSIDVKTSNMTINQLTDAIKDLEEISLGNQVGYCPQDGSVVIRDSLGEISIGNKEIMNITTVSKGTSVYCKKSLFSKNAGIFFTETK